MFQLGILVPNVIKPPNYIATAVLKLYAVAASVLLSFYRLEEIKDYAKNV